YTVTGCTSAHLAAMPANTTGVGVTVTLTASSACPNPSPQYEFWTLAPGASSWTMAQAYSTTNTFGWSTTGKAPGGWQLAVWVRDASSAGAYSISLGTFDLSVSIPYSVTTCTAVSLSAMPASTAGVGTTVTVTAGATGCPNPSPQFQFWILAPGAGWTVVQAYSTSNTFSWSTTGKAAGSYYVAVWVRDASSGGTFSNGAGSWDLFGNIPYSLT
ncbi:MAG TPA: hypothetical protein VHQ03_02545, partial [Candidatus Dormibacteraeota bacterium]|nr:hypothetical protein [Candidatus Dormibacteraeota bacterium]